MFHVSCFKPGLTSELYFRIIVIDQNRTLFWELDNWGNGDAAKGRSGWEDEAMVALFLVEILIFFGMLALFWFLVGRHMNNWLDKITKKDKHGIGPDEFKKKIAGLESRIKELEKEEEKEENLVEMQRLHSELEDLKNKLGEL